MNKRRRFNLRGILLFLLITGASVVLVAAFNWRRDAADKAVHESQRQDYALCVAQNAAREANRVTASATYALVAGVLRAGGPDNPQLKLVFERQEAKLARQLKALRPLDCETYVRPDIPPDQGSR